MCVCGTTSQALMSIYFLCFEFGLGRPSFLFNKSKKGSIVSETDFENNIIHVGVHCVVLLCMVCQLSVQAYTFG
jgi:hypothetical protein